jgi:flagellar hook-basal body protein
LGVLQTPSSLETAQRGKPSYPATLAGETLTINTSGNVAVVEANNDFTVSVDGITAKISVESGSYSMETLAAKLNEKINSIVDPVSKREVAGVDVKWDSKAKQLVFTTGTTGDAASIQVTGHPDWGLANTEMRFGQTTQWIKLAQYADNGALQYVRNGKQTEDISDLNTKNDWWPVFLDRGELTFDLTGKPISPIKPMGFETAFLQGGKGALTMSIDFTQSTQYSSSFAVLSQAQDGAPEGELMGLDIGVDGLVNATYSNGSQNSLGKIVLANFSSPSGLRQVGDASYLASATSGIAKVGEAGSAGFGSIRAGATERANVDLTQELVDLITAQRNFQANAKAIETSSTMTSAIINIRS